MDLQRVKGNGCQLYYPITFPEQTRYRGAEGYVVDLDAPGEREFCKGQEWKLEPAPDGSTPDAIRHPTAMKLGAEIVRREAAEADAEKAEAMQIGLEADVGTGTQEPTSAKADPLDQSSRRRTASKVSP